MEEWLVCSLISCLLYSIWTILNKLSLRTIDSTASNLLQLPVRTAVTLVTAFRRVTPGTSISVGYIVTRIGDLNLFGVIFACISCIASVMATFYLGDALERGGSASSVSIVTGSYPALAYVLSVVLGLEKLDFIKVLGVFLAMGSCYCFSQ